MNQSNKLNEMKMWKNMKARMKGVKNGVMNAARQAALGMARPAMALGMTVGLLTLTPMGAWAQNAAGDYSAGTTALATVTTEIAKYVPYVVKLCYAIAGVVAVVGAVSVYIAMNNEEQDVKKRIMLLVGACVFLVAAAQALPLFFGVTN